MGNTNCFRSIKYCLRAGYRYLCDISKTRASIPKVVGSVPTVVRHIFQACPVWIYTQSNITSNNGIDYYFIHCLLTLITVTVSQRHDQMRLTALYVQIYQI